MTKAREAAYKAIYHALKQESFATDTLKQWKQTFVPSQADYHFARELAFGVLRRILTLDHLAKELTPDKKLNVKFRERVILRMAVYQKVFMAKVPDHAVVNESVELAKKYCHPTFVKFLNALLRSLMIEIPELPQGLTVPELSLRYSYPEYFIDQLIQTIGLEKTKEVLKAQNEPSLTMYRILDQKGAVEEKNGASLIAGATTPVALLEDSSLLPMIARSSDYYIQNITQISLMDKLIEQSGEMHRILDLCASPGGKLLSLYQAYPNAELHANDISIEKLKKLEQNKEKYKIPVKLHMGLGENYTTKEPFDLVVIDAPCSNSGVLSKRPEARWRLSKEQLKSLTTQQKQLLTNSLTLIANGSEVWYLTCSILKIENEQMVEEFAEENDLEIKYKETILPNTTGFEGGFAAALIKKQ